MRIGVLSLAHVHAEGVVRGLLDLPGVEVLVTDPHHRERPVDETGGPALAAALGAPCVETLDELLAWRPDGVVVCSENTRHREDVERVAAAGAHVLCEKPLATTLADARAMVAACEAAGVRLATAYPVRFSPAFADLRAAHAVGALGRVRSIQGTNNGGVPRGRWFTEPQWSGGGALVDHVVHVADLVDVLLDGVPATSVLAMTGAGFPGAGAVESAALLSIAYADGTIVSLDASWSVPVGYPTWGGLTLDVVGDRANAALDAFGQRVDGFRTSTGRAVRLEHDVDTGDLMLRDFLRVVETGEPPWADPASSLRSLAVALAALESSASGVPVDPRSL